MLINYLPVLILFILALGFAIASIGLSFVLGPKSSNKHKLEPYECGMKPIGSTRERFPIRFYLMAMLFIIFDIEIIFLYPWAVIFLRADQIRLFFLVEMLVFVGILLMGYVCIWRKGALEWED